MTELEMAERCGEAMWNDDKASHSLTRLQRLQQSELRCVLPD